MRGVRWAGCTGKKGYIYLQHARYDVRKLKERGENGLHVYHCPVCKIWHVGHSTTYMTDYPAYGRTSPRSPRRVL